MSVSIKVASYNILAPFFAVKWNEKAGLNKKGRETSKETLRASTQEKEPDQWQIYSNWKKRCPIISKSIQLADIICLQEVTPSTINDIIPLTNGYRLANISYHPNPTQSVKYGNAVLFNSKIASLTRKFTIMSPCRERAASCAQFKIKNKIINVASVHLKGYYTEETDFKKKQEAKLSGYRELETYVKKLKEESQNTHGTVIAGDYNEDIREMKYKYHRMGFLAQNNYHFDGNLKPTEPSKHKRIDWIYFKSNVKSRFSLKPLGVIMEQASDHLMTRTRIICN